MSGIMWQLGKCLPAQWRLRIRRKILLWRPSLYAHGRIQYEQSLSPDEVDRVLAKLDTAISLPGDVIECGCFLCGTTVHLARRLQSQHSERRVLACDTFAGFDPDEIAREQRQGDAREDDMFATNDFHYVQRKLACLGVAERVTLVRGLFQETLESLAGPFCFALIDCDLHDSMLYAAQTVWPRLSPGGTCVFDDYDNTEYKGATRAIDTFIEANSGQIAEHGRLSRKMYFAVKKASPTS